MVFPATESFASPVMWTVGRAKLATIVLGRRKDERPVISMFPPGAEISEATLIRSPVNRTVAPASVRIFESACRSIKPVASTRSSVNESS